MEQSRIKIAKRSIFVVLAIILAAVIYFVVMSAKHSSMGKVIVYVVPKDSLVKIDGHESKKTVYLQPGSHNIEATKEGFAPSKVNITLKKGDIRDVYLMPIPVSDEAKRWLNDHPEIQAQREAYASANVSYIQNTIQKNYPIINELPLDTASYNIDYGASKQHPNDPTKIALYITALPVNREMAMQWMRYKGFSPDDYEIIYKSP